MTSFLMHCGGYTSNGGKAGNTVAYLRPGLLTENNSYYYYSGGGNNGNGDVIHLLLLPFPLGFKFLIFLEYYN